jgi:hypothetical protein
MGCLLLPFSPVLLKEFAAFATALAHHSRGTRIHPGVALAGEELLDNLSFRVKDERVRALLNGQRWCLGLPDRHAVPFVHTHVLEVETGCSDRVRLEDIGKVSADLGVPVVLGALLAVDDLNQNRIGRIVRDNTIEIAVPEMLQKVLANHVREKNVVTFNGDTFLGTIVNELKGQDQSGDQADSLATTLGGGRYGEAQGVDGHDRSYFSVECVWSSCFVRLPFVVGLC